MVGSPPQPVNWWFPPYMTSSPLNIGWCSHAVGLSGDPSTLGITWTFTRNLQGGGFQYFPTKFYGTPYSSWFFMACAQPQCAINPPLGGIPSSKSLGLAI